MNIAQMNLHSRQSDRLYCIADCIGIMRVCSRIDYDSVKLVHCGMYCIDDITLVIGLERCKFRTAGYDIAIQFFRNRLKRIRSVYIRRAHPCQIQVWTVNNNKFHARAMRW